MLRRSSIIPAQRCSMLFVDAEAHRCYVIASHDDPRLKMLEIDLRKYPEVREAIQTRNPVLVQNAPDDPVMAEVRELLKNLDFRSILVVPLIVTEATDKGSPAAGPLGVMDILPMLRRKLPMLYR